MQDNSVKGLLDKSNFYLSLCNPKPKTKFLDLPNIFKLRSKSDITNLNMALVKVNRKLDLNNKKPKRICIEIVSDVLVNHGVKVTRNWISELISNMGSKGFTMLVILDSGMHDTKDVNAILNLFDGEISIIHTKDPLECKKSIRVEKLRNQDYIKNPLCLTNQK